jgi:hypothetical protein
LQNIVNNKGGLHNRITRRIYLLPFNHYETDAFLRSKHIVFELYRVAPIYMAMGGSLTTYLDELTHSGFITPFNTFGKKQKDLLFRLTDEYSLFYLQFMQNYQSPQKDTWQQLSQTQEYKTWS